MDIQIIKKYYDDHIMDKINGYINKNIRVERAWNEIDTWIGFDQKNILEIGCGIGDVAYRFAQKYPFINFHAFDISPKSINIGRQLFNLPNLFFYCSDDIRLNKFDSNIKFDVIYLIDVFEHLGHEEKNSLELFLKDHLSEDGIMFFSCPTPHHQNFLRTHKPEGLQPIDLDVNLSDFILFAERLGKKILYYKEISVWDNGDYVHTVIGTKTIKNKVYSNGFFEKYGLKTAIKKFIIDKLSPQKNEVQFRKKHVSLIMKNINKNYIK